MQEYGGAECKSTKGGAESRVQEYGAGEYGAEEYGAESRVRG